MLENLRQLVFLIDTLIYVVGNLCDYVKIWAWDGSNWCHL